MLTGSLCITFIGSACNYHTVKQYLVNQYVNGILSDRIWKVKRVAEMVAYYTFMNRYTYYLPNMEIIQGITSSASQRGSRGKRENQACPGNHSLTPYLTQSVFPYTSESFHQNDNFRGSHFLLGDKFHER